MAWSSPFVTPCLQMHLENQDLLSVKHAKNRQIMLDKNEKILIDIDDQYDNSKNDLPQPFWE